MRAFLTALLASAALVAAGCGGGSSSSSGVSADSATVSLAPPDAGLWVSIDTDRGSGQWQGLETVLKRIPGAEGLLDQALAEIGSNGAKVDFAKDVQPALGKELVVVLPFGAADPVVLLQPGDEAAFDRLLAKAEKPPVTEKRNGWTIVGQTQKAIDTYDTAAAKGSLAGSESFRAAMDGLPDEALARIYVDPKGLGAAGAAASSAAAGALSNLPTGKLNVTAGGTTVDPKTLEKLGAFGLAVSADDDAVHLDGTYQLGDQPVEAYDPTLLRQVPGDALAALSFSGKGVATQVSQALAGEAEVGKQLDKTLGVSLADLAGVVDGQGVAYLRRGLIIPEVTVVLEPGDPARALATIDGAVTKLVAKQGAKVTVATEGGITWKRVQVSILAVSWGRDGDRIVITTLPSGYQDFKGSGDKLVDTGRFQTVADEVDFGDKTAGLAYVDVKGLVPLVNMIASAAGDAATDPEFTKLVDALKALDTAALNSTVDGGRVHAHGIVRVTGSG